MAKPINAEYLESIQHEAFVLGQATGMLSKHGYKELAVQLYTAAYEIMEKQKGATSG
jgi:hypothetical protein